MSSGLIDDAPTTLFIIRTRRRNGGRKTLGMLNAGKLVGIPVGVLLPQPDGLQHLIDLPVDIRRIPDTLGRVDVRT